VAGKAVFTASARAVLVVGACTVEDPNGGMIITATMANTAVARAAATRMVVLSMGLIVTTPVGYAQSLATFTVCVVKSTVFYGLQVRDVSAFTHQWGGKYVSYAEIRG